LNDISDDLLPGIRPAKIIPRWCRQNVYAAWPVGADLIFTYFTQN